MKKLTLFISIIFFVIYANAQSQDTIEINKRELNLKFVDLYRENHPLSYFSLPYVGELGAKNKYIFTARLSTSFMVIGTKGSPFALALVPDFTVRMLDIKSKPVYTPDFRIGFIGYYRLNHSAENYRYATFAFMHHSNAQDINDKPIVGTLNYKNWDFSTFYIYGRYNWGSNEIDNNIVWNSINHQVELKTNVLGDSPVIHGDFGFTRVGYNLSFRTYSYFTDLLKKEENRYYRKSKMPAKNDSSTGWLNKERFRWEFDLSYAINKYDNYDFFAAKRRLNTEGRFYWSPYFMRQTALMLAAGYYGEDPYNIYFKDRYAWIRTGIAVGFLKYKAKASRSNYQTNGIN